MFMASKVCLVTGVGGATGAAIARRFAAEGYRVAMLARNRERLNRLEEEIAGSKAYVCDVGDLPGLTSTIERVRGDLGIPSVLVHNAVSATFGTFLEADPAELERNFRVNTTSLLHLVRALAPHMIRAGEGALVVTGNTSSLRGVPNYALFAPTKAAQRILAQSLARDLGPKRVHVSYVTIDGAIDAPWLSENGHKPPPWHPPPADWTRPRADWFVEPDAIAEEVFRMAHQRPSAWTFDLIVRPYAEKW
jgi:NAD(P)-dependent dehydrogenase (short-subunit alcohol dehydrogenase family)